MHKKANKSMIKKAGGAFPRRQVSVRTANYDGKLKRQGRSEGLTPSYKKAVVQLREDSKPIAFFESLS